MEQGVYQYDALGRRFQKTSKGQITKYFNDGWSVLFETNQAGVLGKSYVLGPRIDEILQSAGQNYLYDGLGSVTGLANSSGAKSATYGYDVFGSLRFKSGTSANANNYLFTGRELDPESTLYNYRNRYYNPSVGRFLTKDPIGLEGGINEYSYVENNPVNYVDAEGLVRFPAAVKKGLQVAVSVVGIIVGMVNPSDGSPVKGTGQAKGNRAPIEITVPKPKEKEKKKKKSEDVDKKNEDPRCEINRPLPPAPIRMPSEIEFL